MVAFVFGAFGLIIGSFLNVLILRHGVRGVGGRSGCMSCGAQLSWYDMVPVCSWLVLGGKCRACRAPISAQYPLVEIMTAILFAVVGASELLFLGKVLACVIVAILIAITVYDIRHTIIPDEWVWTLNTLAIVFAFAFPLQPTIYYLQAALAGPIAAAPLFALWLFSRGRWMGLGDAKLALGIGWLLGPALGLFSIFSAFVIGALVSVCILMPLPHIVRALYTLGITSSGKSLGGFTMKSEIPFGPFLIFSCIIIWFASIYGIQPLHVLGLLPLLSLSS